MTSRRTKQPIPAGKAEGVSLGGLRYAGRDRRTAKEYARDLERETEASLQRDPERWPSRRTDEIPKDRGAGLTRRHDESQSAAAGKRSRDHGA